MINYKNATKNGLLISLVMMLTFVFLMLSGCGNSEEVKKLKDEIAVKDGEIATLNQTIEKFSAEDDEYIDDEGHKINVIGGRISERESDILIYSLANKKGFAVWLQNGVPYSGENVIKVSKASIQSNTEYKALYTCVGFMALQLENGNLNISGNTTGATFGDFEEQLTGTTQIMSVKYSFVNGSGRLDTNMEASDMIQIDTNEIGELTNVAPVNYINKEVVANKGKIWFIKLYIKDGVDPYSFDPYENFDEEEDDEADLENADHACVSVFIMEKKVLSTGESILDCISIQNQKSGDNAESKTFSIRIKGV